MSSNKEVKSKNFKKGKERKYLFPISSNELMLINRICTKNQAGKKDIFIEMQPIEFADVVNI